MSGLSRRRFVAGCSALGAMTSVSRLCFGAPRTTQTADSTEHRVLLLVGASRESRKCAEAFVRAGDYVADGTHAVMPSVIRQHDYAAMPARSANLPWDFALTSRTRIVAFLNDSDTLALEGQLRHVRFAQLHRAYHAFGPTSAAHYFHHSSGDYRHVRAALETSGGACADTPWPSTLGRALARPGRSDAVAVTGSRHSERKAADVLDAMTDGLVSSVFTL